MADEQQAQRLREGRALIDRHRAEITAFNVNGEQLGFRIEGPFLWRRSGDDDVWGLDPQTHPASFS